MMSIRKIEKVLYLKAGKFAYFFCQQFSIYTNLHIDARFKLAQSFVDQGIPFTTDYAIVHLHFRCFTFHWQDVIDTVIVSLAADMACAS